MAKLIGEYESGGEESKPSGFIQFLVEGDKFIIRSGKREKVNRTDVFDKEEVSEMLKDILSSYSDLKENQWKSNSEEVAEAVGRAVNRQKMPDLEERIIKNLVIPGNKNEIHSAREARQALDNLDDLRGKVIGLLEDNPYLKRGVSERKRS